ncbi:GH18819 [Drosophila grimshawi]|uniref:GH18819 n=2 Tax=Drosophila grimshawi TaxID=7222 RepID=B4JFY6_DROGR|nr:GH18819 [Drosophila grimshawi]
MEQALYYPVPSSREDVYPKRFRPRTTTTPAPKTPTEPTYVWIAGTDWRFKATPVKKPNPIRLHQRIDYRPQSPSYVDPAKWHHWSKYGQRYENWTSARPYYKKYSQPGKWSKWTTPSPNWSNYGKRWYRSVDSKEEDEPYDPEIAPYEAISYPDLEHFTDWRDYHGHRDRRHLFDTFGGFSKLLGIDTKSCILRAICDSKRLLLPPGYSMLQDIVRLIFTMPTISGMEDDYSRIMRMDSEHCDRVFRDKCRLNLLAWLLDGKWGH